MRGNEARVRGRWVLKEPQFLRGGCSIYDEAEDRRIAFVSQIDEAQRIIDAHNAVVEQMVGDSNSDAFEIATVLGDGTALLTPGPGRTKLSRCAVPEHEEECRLPSHADAVKTLAELEKQAAETLPEPPALGASGPIRLGTVDAGDVAAAIARWGSHAGALRAWGREGWARRTGLAVLYQRAKERIDHLEAGLLGLAHRVEANHSPRATMRRKIHKLLAGRTPAIVATLQHKLKTLTAERDELGERVAVLEKRRHEAERTVVGERLAREGTEREVLRLKDELRRIKDAAAEAIREGGE